MGRGVTGAAASGLALLAAGAWSTPAQANGNVSHQWITHAAIEASPEGGSLRALAMDESLRDEIDTGTMFPDWGYTPGASAQEREAGEASHWEPVQEGYRQWIVQQYAPPWSDEARRHLAFYLGLASHGMADQSYDAMFFERSEFYEPGDHSDFDTDTDVMWAAATGPGEGPLLWVPEAPLLELFDQVVGAQIDPESLQQQLSFVGIAINAVGVLAENPRVVAEAQAAFPWAAAHHQDETTPGNPPHEAEIVQRYWRSNWALLHGDPLPRPVLWTHPADGAANHAVDAASIESWITVVFARGLDEGLVDVGAFHLEDSRGSEVPISLDLFYGHESHVVHLRPEVDLEDDTVYVVTVDPGVATIHDEALDGWAFTFATGRRAPAPLNDDGFWDEPDPYGEVDGGSGSGSSGGDGEDDTGAPASTGAAAGGSTTADPGHGEASTSTSDAPGADQDDGGSGCACASGTRPRSIASALLGLVVLGVGRRRRVVVRRRAVATTPRRC